MSSGTITVSRDLLYKAMRQLLEANLLIEKLSGKPISHSLAISYEEYKQKYGELVEYKCRWEESGGQCYLAILLTSLGPDLANVMCELRDPAAEVLPPGSTAGSGCLDPDFGEKEPSR